MKITDIKPDPHICPLCGKSNSCLNLGTKDTTKSCWCNDPSLKFPKELIEQVPPHLRGKACICKSCVLKFQAENADSKSNSSH